jgi:hypothetical protein
MEGMEEKQGDDNRSLLDSLTVLWTCQDFLQSFIQLFLLVIPR